MNSYGRPETTAKSQISVTYLSLDYNTEYYYTNISDYIFSYATY